jgi:hypothetical protein
MLPGIRFLFAAIVLTMSILIFGLGAAALLRAAHEEVSSVPTRRVMPEPVFAQQVEAPPPTLALLRVEPSAPEKTADAPAVAAVAPEPAPEAAPVPQVESDKLAALKPENIAPAEAATPEIAAKPEAAAAEAAAPTLAAAEPPASSETKTAALEVAPAAAAPAVSEPVATPAVTEPATAATKTAALGSPAAKVEKASDAKKADEKADRDEIRKQKRAERAKERRREAARRARLAAQQAAAQQAADPFSQVVQQTPQPAPTQITPRRTRQYSGRPRCDRRAIGRAPFRPRAVIQRRVLDAETIERERQHGGADAGAAARHNRRIKLDTGAGKGGAQFVERFHLAGR